MKFEDIYKPNLLMKGFSIFSRNDEWVEVPVGEVPDTPLMKAFLEDNDIQEIRYCSTNIGMVRTWQKTYKNEGN